MGMDAPQTHAENYAETYPKTYADVYATEDVEQAIEADLSLVPIGRSALQVEPTVLDPAEVDALLGGLTALLRSAEATGDFPADAGQGPAHAMQAGLLPELSQSGQLQSKRPAVERSEHEPYAQTNRRDRRYSQLSPFAWLFPDDAGIGRSARHQQSHHLRARRRTGKKASAPTGQAQGSLFGDHL